MADATPGISGIPEEVIKKMPWWGYVLLTVLGSGALGSSGYIGSLFGAAQAAANNAKKIEALEDKIDRDVQTSAAREQATKSLVERVDTMTRALERQNGRLERLTLIIATTNHVDINMLVPPVSEDP